MVKSIFQFITSLAKVSHWHFCCYLICSTGLPISKHFQCRSYFLSCGVSIFFEMSRSSPSSYSSYVGDLECPCWALPRSVTSLWQVLLLNSSEVPHPCSSVPLSACFSLLSAVLRYTQLPFFRCWPPSLSSTSLCPLSFLDWFVFFSVMFHQSGLVFSDFVLSIFALMFFLFSASMCFC